MRMVVLTPEEMGNVDRAAITAGPHDGYGLMRNAGAAVADLILERFSGAAGVAVLCGPGNNGGDGYVIARLLAERGVNVRLFADAAPQEDSDAARAREDCFVTPEALADFRPETGWLVLDALYGAGLSKPIAGIEAELIERVAAAGVPVVAVDLPSGLSGLTGKPLGSCFNADLTVTFFRKKPGHLLMPGRRLCGELVVADIGIAETALASMDIALWENGPALWRDGVPAVEIDAHKYVRGHVAVVSGGGASTGAARLAARGAARAGAGAVTVLSPANALSVNAMHLTSIMLRKAEAVDELIAFLDERKPTAAVLGPAAGTGERTRSFALGFLERDEGLKGLVLDADAITAFSDTPDALFEAVRSSVIATVLTPHEGEFARLFGDLAADASMSKVERARAAAERSGAVIILKGADTVVACPDGRAAINTNGSRFLATAGSGDVLCGIVASHLAQGMPVFEAASAGVWLHAEAGGMFGRGLIAEDLPEMLPHVFQALFPDDIS